MKNSILIFLTFFASFTFAQTQEWCGTDQMLEEYFNANPGARETFFEEQDNLLSLAAAKGGQNSKAPTIIIPVVVHVVHDNGSGNILKAQIDDGIRILNEDFQMLNSDTSSTRAIFKGVAADSQIEFRLAKIDPNGNCTEGITRTNSFLTYDATNAVKAVEYWPADKYFNIWLVNSINNPGNGLTTLGYAQFPGTGSLSTYGFVCVNREFGSIGTASGSNGRTATHEVGHCFNLLHTFQSGCGAFCQSSGDRVCDTPPASGQTFGCNYTNNSCAFDFQGGNSFNPNPYSTNVPDQLENYMSYDDCQSLFTEGQKTRMQASFTTYSFLNNLRSAANLTASGTNNGFVAPVCNPIAQIEDQDLKLVCQGGQLTFDEQSFQGAVTTYDWRFPGGTPSTSSSASPTVTYNAPGFHDVTLIVSNSSGADTLVVADYVYVNDTTVAYNAFNYSEGFESLSGFGSDWIVLSPSGNAQWARTTIGTAFAGNASVFLDNYGNNNPNESDFLVSPSIDMTQVINPTFKFRLAYKTQTGANDVLKCAISTDCGQTWITRFFANSGSMNTGTVNGSTFIPGPPSDWIDITVTTTGAIRASKNAIFRFDFKAGTTGGNNIFIDEFRVDGASVVGIDDVESFKNSINLYPNPVSDGVVKLDFISESNVESASIFLTDILGKRVKEIYNGSLNTEPYQFNISTDELSSGVYFLSIQAGENNVTKKMIVR